MLFLEVIFYMTGSVKSSRPFDWPCLENSIFIFYYFLGVGVGGGVSFDARVWKDKTH